MMNEQIIQKLKVFRDNGKVLLDPCLIDKDRLWKEMTEVFDMVIEALQLPPAQPELIEKAAYIRGFEQGRTQGMIDTKAEEVAQSDLQLTCNRCHK